jgi:hypothetical protein
MLGIFDDANPAQGVGMGERVFRLGSCRLLKLAGRGELEKCLSRFGGQVAGNFQEPILRSLDDIRKPIVRDADSQQIVGRKRRKNWRGDRFLVSLRGRPPSVDG